MENKERLIYEAKERSKHQILSYPNVIGVGIGKKNDVGDPSITVMVKEKKPLSALAVGTVIPKSVNKIPTDVIQVGEIVALQSRTDKWRPAPGGVSIGHYKITAGTLGTTIEDKQSGAKLILSNNHVLANSNDAIIGDPILQPGSYDGGKVADDTIATLYRFIPIDFGNGTGTCPLSEGYARFGNFLARIFRSSHRITSLQVNPQAVNYVDAAVALPLDQSYVEDRIIDVGIANGVAEATLGLDVTKSGRTTETTHGTVRLTNATISVKYGSQVAMFEDQIVSGFMSQGGDSGSLLVTRYGGTKAVGLLFAGSDQATIYNPIQRVLDALEIAFIRNPVSKADTKIGCSSV